MANWKHYLGNHFSTCTLLAKARDQYRQRDVRIYLIPGADDTSVGVTDGTDSWIAPATESVFSVNIKRVIEDFRKGIKPTIVDHVPQAKQGGGRERHSLRRALLVENPDPQPEPTHPRRTRVQLQPGI